MLSGIPIVGGGDIPVQNSDVTTNVITNPSTYAVVKYLKFQNYHDKVRTTCATAFHRAEKKIRRSCFETLKDKFHIYFLLAKYLKLYEKCQLFSAGYVH